MIELYHYADWVRILFCVVGFFCVVLQTATLVYGFYHLYQDIYLRWTEHILEVLILLQILVLAWFSAQILEYATLGLVFFDGKHLLRYGLFCLLAITSTVVSIKRQLYYPLWIVLVTVFTLPVAEYIFGKAFPVFFAVALLCYTLRSIHIILLRKHELKITLSANSIKMAIDALPIGILFSKKNGHIILINTCMKNLMMTLTGKIYRNAKSFYQDCLINEKYLLTCKRHLIGEDMVYLTHEGSAWMFTKEAIQMKQQVYYQLIGANITERWDMISVLEDQNRKLQKQSEELKQAIFNIQSICYKEESLRIKSHFHDVLGYRIALLLRGLRENKIPNEVMLAEWVKDFMADLRKNEPTQSAKAHLDAIAQTMENIGIAFHLKGQLPEEEAIASIFTEIILEASTNAVRHGLAQDVIIEIEENETGLHMRIKNSGLTPKGEIVEGGGISEMRRKIEMLKGSLAIFTEPEFELYVCIPKGERRG